jgi:Protein of unknown function (DUF1275)
MSGNTTSAGLHIEQSNLAAAEDSFLPFPFFVLGIFVGTLLKRSEPHHSLTRLSLLVATMLTEGVAVFYYAWPGWASILVLSTAMGIMDTSITHEGGQSVSLGFVTGNLNNLGQHFAMGIKRARIGQRAGLVGHILAAGRRVGRHMERLPLGSRAGSGIRGSLGQLDPAVARPHVGGFRYVGPPSDFRHLRWHGNGGFAVVSFPRFWLRSYSALFDVGSV